MPPKLKRVKNKTVPKRYHCKYKILQNKFINKVYVYIVKIIL